MLIWMVVDAPVGMGTFWDVWPIEQHCKACILRVG